MLKIRTYYDDANGSEKFVEWKVEPLLDDPEPIIHREDDESASGGSRGRALWAKEVRKILFSADLTFEEDDKAAFVRFLLGKRWELYRKRGGKWIWVPFTLKVDREIVFEFLEEIRELKRREITLVETDPRWYDEFDDIVADCFSDYSIID
jgi:hypothetical protein